MPVSNDVTDSSFDFAKGPSSGAWASQHTCHWDVYYYSHDGFERVAKYGHEGNLKYVYGGVDLEDDDGNFKESDWSSLPVSGQTLMVEVVLRGSISLGGGRIVHISTLVLF